MATIQRQPNINRSGKHIVRQTLQPIKPQKI